MNVASLLLRCFSFVFHLLHLGLRSSGLGLLVDRFVLLIINYYFDVWHLFIYALNYAEFINTLKN